MTGKADRWGSVLGKKPAAPAEGATPAPGPVAVKAHTRRTPFSTHVPPEVQRELRRLAFTRSDTSGKRVTVADLVCEALDEFLAKQR